jgi:UDP-N-acetylglucosamine 4,6-dehydratase
VAAPIRDIGIRPGEKLHEHMVHSGESGHTEDCGEFYRVHPPTAGYQGCLPEGFEYRTDNNDLGLTLEGMRRLIQESAREEVDL